MRDFVVSQFQCKDCGAIHDYSRLIHSDYEDSVCPGCDGPVEFFQDRPAHWVSVAVYHVGRSYGGPEEGGWWYTEGEIYKPTLRCFEDCDFPQVQDYIDLLNRRFPEKDMNVRLEIETIVESFPTRRPVYC